MRFLTFLLIIAALLVPSSVRGGDGAATVKWGGAPSPNMVSIAKHLPDSLDKAEPLWELQLGSHQYSIPTIDGDRMFLGVNDRGLKRAGVQPTNGGVLMCIDRKTADLIWQLPTPRFFKGVVPPSHFNQWKCGFCSGPVVDGDKVYIISGRGEILCLDREGQRNGNDGPFTGELDYMNVKEPGRKLLPTDGDILWRYDMVKEVDVIPHDVCGSTLLLYNDFLFACTSNGVDDRHNKVPHPLAPSMIVLDKHTGKLIAVDGAKIGTRMLHGHWSSPGFGKAGETPAVFFGGGDGFLYAFALPDAASQPAAEGSKVPSLNLLWSHDCNPPPYRKRYGQEVPYARWNRQSREGPSEIIATPVYYKNRVYVAIGQSPLHGPGNGNLCCVDAKTGEKVWSSTHVDRSLSTAAIKDDLLYISDFSGQLHCFDALTGHRYWDHDLKFGAWSASPFVADGKVYVGAKNNKVWIFKTGKEKKLLSTNRVKSMSITPVAVDGILYLPTQRKLIAYPGTVGK